MLPSCSTSHAVALVSSTADPCPQAEHNNEPDCDTLGRRQARGAPLSAVPPFFREALTCVTELGIVLVTTGVLMVEFE